MAVKARATITLSRVNDGSDGIGVKSTAVTYQASSSQITAPTGTWVTTVPKLTPKTPYLWTRTVITYTDGKTSTSYSVSSTLDGMMVGGRNLLRDTRLMGERAWTDGLYESIKSNIQPDGTVTLPAGTMWGMHDIDINQVGDTISVSLDAKSAETDMNTVLLAIVDFLNDENVRVTYKPLQTNILTAEWKRYSITINVPKAQSITKLRLGLRATKYTDFSPLPGPIMIRLPKLERGNKATDWTPAPEDIDQEIQDVEDTANKAENDSNNALNQTVEIKASLELLDDSIRTLVTDENGQSLMTQTGSGWSFNIGGIQSALDTATKDITDVKGNMSDVSALANKTNQLANDIAKKTAYINMSTDENGDPCMELGKTDSEFKLRITNTSIDFMQGSRRIAYITNKQLYIQSSVVTDEMKIGFPEGFIWKKRSSGNMGLRWIGG